MASLLTNNKKLKTVTKIQNKIIQKKSLKYDLEKEQVHKVLEMLADSLNIGLWQADKNGAIVFYNKKLLELLNLSRKEFESFKTCKDLIKFLVRPNVEKIEDIDLQFDINDRHFNLKCQTIIENNTESGCIGIVKDITANIEILDILNDIKENRI